MVCNKLERGRWGAVTAALVIVVVGAAVVATEASLASGTPCFW